MELDLHREAAEVYRYIVSRTEAFSPFGNVGPGGMRSVKMVYAGYAFDQAGWFALVFDRLPDAGHDGEWTAHREGNMLERPAWALARERNEEWPIPIRAEDGCLLTIPVRTEFGPLIGRMLVGVL